MKQDVVTAPPDRGLVQRALGGHAAIGLLAGALLYIIALSGTLVVIHERWQRWEQPAIAEMQTIAPDAVQRAVLAGFAKDRGRPRTTHLYVHLPTDDLPRTVVTTDHGAVYVDARGAIAGPEAHGWTEFLIALHEYLHLPMTLGLIVVGGLGAMLASLCVTGVVAHPRILRDAFRLRARGNRQVAHADWHNRLGVWTLPFVLAIALTGAFMGLSSIGATVLARSYYGGSLERAYAPIFGDEAKPDARAAVVADASAALRDMARRFPQVVPTYVTIHDPGTLGQEIQVLAVHPRRLIYGESYRYDARGTFRGTVGLSDGALGQQAAASTYKLHFGDFGGLAVELAYMALGLALCVVTATGMSLWLQKRRRRGHASPRLEAFWTVTVWGVPLLIAAMLWLRAAAGAQAPMAGAFWGLYAVALILGMARPALVEARLLRLALAAVLAATALGHAVLALAAGGVLRPSVLAIDLALLGVAAVLGRSVRRSR